MADNRKGKLNLFMILAALAAAAIASAGPAQSREVRVIDGDSIVVNDGERVRLSGIDAPSTVKNGPQRAMCSAELERGMLSKNRLTELLSGNDFRLTYDRYSGDKRRDKYGRTLAKVKVGKQDVGAVLIGEGLAQSWNGRGARPSWCSPQMKSGLKRRAK